MEKPFTFQNLTLEDETPNCGPRFWVHQLPGVANWSYYLRLMRMIARWKNLSKDYNGKDDFLIENSLAVDFPKNVV